MHTHTPHRHSQFSLPVYWTIGPINRWLWGGHVKQSDWLSRIWLLIAWHPCPCPRLLAPALETGQWGGRKQQLLCGLTLLEGTEVGGWMDGWMDDNIRNISGWSMGIHSQRRLYTVIQNEWDEAVSGHDAQIYISTGTLTIQMFLEPHPPPRWSQLGFEPATYQAKVSSFSHQGTTGLFIEVILYRIYLSLFLSFLMLQGSIQFIIHSYIKTEFSCMKYNKYAGISLHRQEQLTPGLQDLMCSRNVWDYLHILDWDTV